MKIAILANIASVHTQRWVAALSERGHFIHLITLPKQAREQIEFKLGCSILAERERLRIHVLPFRAPAGYYLNLPWARWILVKNKPDLLHAHYASGYGTLGRLCKYHPYVLSVWGSDVFAFSDASSFNRRLLINNISVADWICSTSHFMANRTFNLCPQLKGLTVTPFGVDTDKFKPYTKVPFRDQVSIGTVKTLSEPYGIDILIRAFSRVCQRLRVGTPYNPQLKLNLLIIGTGPQYGALKKLANELCMEGIVKFTGLVKHESMPEYMNQLDVYLSLIHISEPTRPY